MRLLGIVGWTGDLAAVDPPTGSLGRPRSVKRPTVEPDRRAYRAYNRLPEEDRPVAMTPTVHVTRRSLPPRLGPGDRADRDGGERVDRGVRRPRRERRPADRQLHRRRPGDARLRPGRPGQRTDRRRGRRARRHASRSTCSSFQPADWGWTATIPGFGLLADDFPDPRYGSRASRPADAPSSCPASGSRSRRSAARSAWRRHDRPATRPSRPTSTAGTWTPGT